MKRRPKWEIDNTKEKEKEEGNPHTQRCIAIFLPNLPNQRDIDIHRLTKRTRRKIERGVQELIPPLSICITFWDLATSAHVP